MRSRGLRVSRHRLRLPRRAAARGRRRGRRVHPRRRSRTRRSGSARCANSRRRTACRCSRRTSVNTPEWIARIAAWRPGLHLLLLLSQAAVARRCWRCRARGALNLHGSLLPKYRGRCPVNWVLDSRRARDRRDPALHGGEAGPRRHRRAAARADHRRRHGAHAVPQAHRRAAALLMREIYPLLCAGTAPRIAAGPLAAPATSAAAGRRTGASTGRSRRAPIFNLVRAVTHPYPGAFTHVAGPHAASSGRRTSAPPVATVHAAPVRSSPCAPDADGADRQRRAAADARPAGRRRRTARARSGRERACRSGRRSC